MDVITLFAFSASLCHTYFLAFLISGFIKQKRQNSTNRKNHLSGSVVVAARNEEHTIKNLLEALANQRNGSTPVQFVMVNDRSSDGTGDILERYARKRKNMRVIHIEEVPSRISPKKHALQKGIAGAEGEIILTTDADCQPSPSWIETTCTRFTPEVGVVAGLAPLHPSKSWLSKLICLENLASNLVAAGTTGWQVAVTCTGRNLAFRKVVYEEVGGYKDHIHSISGDDDLFLQNVARKTSWKIIFNVQLGSAVFSKAPIRISDYIRQRRRHISASKYYPRHLQLAFFIFELANLALFGFLIRGLIHTTYLLWAFIIFTLKLSLEFWGLYLVAKRVNQKRLLWHFPIWQIFHLANQWMISPLGLVGKIKWK